jgi:hypothetical protein
MKWKAPRFSVCGCDSLRLSRRWLVSVLITVQLLVSAGATPLFTQNTAESAALLDPGTVPEGVARSDWQGIRAAHEVWRHSFQRVDHGWETRNPGQQWTTAFDERGFLTRPQDGRWTWGLELQGYGFGAHQEGPASPAADARAEGQRLSREWDDTVEEWFVNDRRGLEHGFTVKQRPPQAGRAEDAELVFVLGIRGGLQPRVSADARSVSFHEGAGIAVLHYAGLKVWDARGVILPSRFETGKETNVFRLLVDERGAHYPVTIDPVAQQAYLKPAAVGTTQVRDAFGFSVAISGDTVTVGAPTEDSSTTGVVPNENGAATGAVYVFVRNGGVWTQQAYLKADNNTPGGFGESVAMSGDTIVVGKSREFLPGVSGGVYVFVRSAGVWTQQALLTGSNFISNQRFGSSVAVSGDTIIAGVSQDSYGTTGVNGTPGGVAHYSGAAFIFVRSGGVWTQQAWLKAGNTGAEDQFGITVAISGDTAVVGAALEDSSTNVINGPSDELADNSGAAYVFVRNAGVWTQQAFLKSANSGGSDKFGNSVAIQGDTIAVGAPGESSSATGVNGVPDNNSAGSGAVYIFGRNGGTWTQQAFLKTSNTGEGDLFGTSVALSGDVLVAGAPFEDSSGTTVNSTPNELAAESGAAYVFVRSGGAWTQQAFLKSSGSGPGDSVGSAVAVSGDTAVVSAPGDDSSTTGVNSTPNELAADAGAAFIFSGLGSSAPPVTLQGWRELHFGTTANTGTAANLFDADGDGIPNLVEYGFDLDPTSGASVQLPAVQRAGSGLTVTFTQPAGVSGVTYGAQWSASLLPGSWAAISDTGSGNVHTFTVPAGTGGEVFLRLTVTEP